MKCYVFERAERVRYYAKSEEEARALLDDDVGDETEYVLLNVEDA